MSLSEILLIIIVALVVFGPDKIPVLARQAGKIIAYLQQLTAKTNTHIQQQLLVSQLEQNEARARCADKQYQASEVKLEDKDATYSDNS